MNRLNIKKVVMSVVTLMLVTTFISPNFEVSLVGNKVSFTETAYAGCTYYPEITDPQLCRQAGGFWQTEGGDPTYSEFCVQDIFMWENYGIGRVDGAHDAFTCQSQRNYWYVQQSGGSSDSGSSGDDYYPPQSPSPVYEYVTEYIYHDIVTKEVVYVNHQDVVTHLADKGLGNSNIKSNSNINISGAVDDGSKTKLKKDFSSNSIYFTNLTSSGKITVQAKEWRPMLNIVYNGSTINLPVPTEQEILKSHNKSLSEFKTPKKKQSTVEVLLYQVKSMEALETLTSGKDSMKAVFEKDSVGNYKHGDSIVSITLDQRGIRGYDSLKVREEGTYILATKYYSGDKDGSESDKTDYTYTAIEVNFSNSDGYLPIDNNFRSKINEYFLTNSGLKGGHQVTNLKYKNSETSYNSMKVPSSFNAVNETTLIGSTNGGIKLMDKSLKPVSITSPDTDLNTLKVTNIKSYGKGFIVSSDRGIFILDCDSKTLSKTVVTLSINDIEVINDTLYSLSDNKLVTYFIVGSTLIPTVDEYELSNTFSVSGKKAGRVQVTGDLITVSSKDEGRDSEVIILTKK